MHKLSAHFAFASVTVLLLAPSLSLHAADEPGPAAGTSKIRIVRLSEVKGTVKLDRNIDRGFEPAMANLPIVENSKLITGNGVAEVEFEDNSTLRLAPDSEVEFPRLERLASGSTASSVHLLKGTAYVSLVKTRGNEFNLLFGDQKLQLEPAAHIRLQLEANEARLAVIDGSVHVDGPEHALDVPKKKTITFDLQASTEPRVDKNIAEDPFDGWDQTSSGYHARTAAYSALASTPYSYGVNDMMYYGSFADMGGGCGSMWRPYFTSAAWDPYSNGAWAWYSGAGYSWVSPYPWAWTPYHYGSWNYCPGAGWGWMPGGSWTGLNNSALFAVRQPSGGGTHIPVVPVHPPAIGEPTLRAVNLKPIVVSNVASTEAFVFRKDSAGLGVPRDGLGNLNKFSQHAAQHGTVTTPIYVNVPTAGPINGRAANSNLAAATIHRGSAPQSFGGGMQAQPGMRGSAGPSNNGGSFGNSGGASQSAPRSVSAPSAPASGGHPR